MNDHFDRKSKRVLKNHGVITYTPSRLPGIFSFLLTGALFAAALLLSLSQALANGDDEGSHQDRCAQLSSACQDAKAGGKK